MTDALRPSSCVVPSRSFAVHPLLECGFGISPGRLLFALNGDTDAEALWAGIANGSIHTVCTDHAPWMLKDKLDPGLDITKLRPGVENLQMMLPMLYSEGVRKGRITQNRLSK